MYAMWNGHPAACDLNATSVHSTVSGSGEFTTYVGKGDGMCGTKLSEYIFIT